MILASDTGFSNAVAARAAMRRLKLRRALRDAQALISALLDRLDQAAQPHCSGAASVCRSRIDLLAGNFEGRVRGLAIDLVKGQDMREQELLQGVDLVLQFLNALLDELGHGRFSNCFDTPSANPEAPGRAPSM